MGAIRRCREQISRGCYGLRKGQSREGALAACRMDTLSRFSNEGGLPGRGDNEAEAENA